MSGYYDPGYYQGGHQQTYTGEAFYAGDPNQPGQFGQQAYLATGDMNPSYYNASNQDFGYSQQGGVFGNGYTQAGASATLPTKEGTFYFHDEFAPQINGSPISAVAMDGAFQAMYVASTTQVVSSTRWKSHRSSMLATHNTLDGMIYSAVAGHPEASSATLQTVYECMFGIARLSPMSSGRHHIPPHAYRAPFGSTEMGATMSVMSPGEKSGHIGITSILPLDGYAATISPAAIRLHTHGGLQVQDYNLEGMLSGTIHPHSDQGPTHISVGGVPCNSEGKHSGQEVHCMDIWQGLRIVSSRSFKDKYENKMGVTALATSHDRGSIVAGCSDGNIRLLDGALREVGTVKSHKGGVSSISVSPDGLLIATTGYSSRPKDKNSSVLFAFPDPTVYIYDIRRLGRAGIPHPFAGVGGAPHHVSFLPDVNDSRSSRLLVGSGRAGGGLQVIVPFEAPSNDPTSFLLPPLAQGESISAMSQRDEDLVLGTSDGRVLRYKLTAYEATPKSIRATSGVFTPGGVAPSPPHDSTSRRVQTEKKPLSLPSFGPPIPTIYMDPKLLLHGKEPGSRFEASDKFRSIFSAYTLQREPKLSAIGNSPEEAIVRFGPLGGKPIVAGGKLAITSGLLEGAVTQAQGDLMTTIPVSKLGINLLSDHTLVSKRYEGKKPREIKPNPNKFLYNAKLSVLCYDGGPGRMRGMRPVSNGSIPGDVPERYRPPHRPSFTSSGAFDPCDHNNTGLLPGWDYSPTSPNAFAPPVLMMLYFVTEIRSAALDAQFNDKLFPTKIYDKTLSPELGFVFHQIECLSQYGLLYPPKPGADPKGARIGAWIPANFLATLSTLPEAEQLQILDGSPAAVNLPQRAEAFYRFMAYQLDKELSKSTEHKLMDSLHGIDFVSSNLFLTGSSAPSESSTRAMTLDLSYDLFQRVENKRDIRFGDLLQHSLCRETRLRAWNAKNKAFETIVQRKIVTSMPQVLTLSCSCAGRKEEDGLWVWRTDDGEPWLPEFIEVTLEDNGSITVKELKASQEGFEQGKAFKGNSLLPEAVAKLVADKSTKGTYRYRLEAVLSFVSSSLDSTTTDEYPGHHVLHVRVPSSYKRRILASQIEEAVKFESSALDSVKTTPTNAVALDVLRTRLVDVEQRLSTLEYGDESSWILFNGFAVSDTVIEDARAFHVSFKEPCLVVFRELGGDKKDGEQLVPSNAVPTHFMNSRSFSNVSSNKLNLDTIRKGALLAFDAEFVSIQEEKATLSESGSKVVLRETRLAVGRISVIDCATRATIIDEHVLPGERVVDYLTRFSGIVAEDLDPSKTSHCLISTRTAYLKLRYLMEQGCIFVGHGLRQDFATVNLVVPPCQIVDTVEIYHQPGQRYISLRFLANYVLGRDMQQDVHDSVEDAMAAFELYEVAMNWKEDGSFDRRLTEIYAHGQKTDWKLVAEGS